MSEMAIQVKDLSKVYKLYNIFRCFFKTDHYAFLFWLSIEQAHHS